LRESLPPWSVNTLAQAVGVRALADAAFRERTRQTVAGLRERLATGLRRLRCTVFPGQANYLLTRLPDNAPNSTALCRRLLADAGVAVRDCANFPELDDRSIRIAVRPEAETDRILAALAAILDPPAAPAFLPKRPTPALMVQGTTSNAGKSVLCAGLCRLLARRGYTVVGVDITAAYVADARETAQREGLGRAEFVQGDVREVAYEGEYDVVLNMADGAIGYFDTDAENLRLFDVIGRALQPGGKHVMGICSAEHAAAHFPKRHWEAGSRSLSLADFAWNAAKSRMNYLSRVLRFGEPLEAFPDAFPPDEGPGTRLYTLAELAAILGERGMAITAAYGAYDTSVPASPAHLMQVVCSRKL
jgi:hypothetical protein